MTVQVVPNMRDSAIENWDRVYREARHRSVWPWSHVVTLVNRHVPEFRSGIRVLELGCGAGANIRFFVENGAEFWGIEGSESMVVQLRLAFPELADRLICADFTHPVEIEGSFDLVLDRGSITHNSTAAVVRTMDLVHDYLRPGGWFIGTDWFGTGSDEYCNGTPTDDPYVRDDFEDGPFADVGVTHFFDREHVEQMLGPLDLVALYRRTTDRVFPDPPHSHEAWDVVARRPETG